MHLLYGLQDLGHFMPRKPFWLDAPLSSFRRNEWSHLIFLNKSMDLTDPKVQNVYNPKVTAAITDPQRPHTDFGFTIWHKFKMEFAVIISAASSEIHFYTWQFIDSTQTNLRYIHLSSYVNILTDSPKRKMFCETMKVLNVHFPCLHPYRGSGCGTSRGSATCWGR